MCQNPNLIQTQHKLALTQKVLSIPPSSPSIIHHHQPYTQTQCQQYLSYYVSEFEQNLKEGFWDNIQLVTTVTVTPVHATFVLVTFNLVTFILPQLKLLF